MRSDLPSLSEVRRGRLIYNSVGMFQTFNMARLIAANQVLKTGFPQGLPEGLLIRGLGQAMDSTLVKLGESQEEITGHVVLVTDAVTKEILGPKFCLRGKNVNMN